MVVQKVQVVARYLRNTESHVPSRPLRDRHQFLSGSENAYRPCDIFSRLEKAMISSPWDK